jgi:hypothetical protein
MQRQNKTKLALSNIKYKPKHHININLPQGILIPLLTYPPLDHGSLLVLTDAAFFSPRQFWPHFCTRIVGMMLTPTRSAAATPALAPIPTLVNMAGNLSSS